MKNTMAKTIGITTLVIVMMAAFGQFSAFAQADIRTSDKGEQEDAEMLRSNSRRLEGSWNHQGMRLNCTTGAVVGTFQALFTFNRGGTFWEAGTQVSPALRSSSHGLWTYESRQRYTTAFQFFRFNADGTHAGRQIVRQEILMSPDGNSYTATATAQVLDVNGNVIQNNCAAGSGTRFE